MTKLQATKIPLSQLVADLDVTIQGDANSIVSGVATIQNANTGDIAFLTNPKYKKYLATTQASAVILTKAYAPFYSGSAIICDNPHYVYAKIAHRFYNANANISKNNIHPSAVIEEDAEIAATAIIGPNAVIGKHAKIAADVKIGAGCVVGNFVEIANETILDANVTIYDYVKIGKRVHIASGAVIGSDGFGFAVNNKDGSWHKVPQFGTVILEDDVDIGANTTIDCGALENTVIEKGVKLDNLIQIGHNVRIGQHTIMAGCTAVAGSVEIGKHCAIGGGSCIAGHINIADKVMVTGMSAVEKSITESGMYSSGVLGITPSHEFKKRNARIQRIEKLVDRIKKLEATLKDREKN